MLEKILSLGKRVIPKKVFTILQPAYHWLLSLAGAIIYCFPSRHIKVVAVTGTKGKSTTVEFINSILEEAGFKTAVLGTIRFKIGDTVERNLFKMTIPGRFFVQKFIRRAVNAGCDWIVIEMTSEGAKQFRHKWIDFDALVFTNLAPEHIESHGSYEKYRDAKLSIARVLAHSYKKDTAIIANADDKEGHLFLTCGAQRQFPFSLKDAQPYEVTDSHTIFTWKDIHIASKLPGVFNLYNMLGAATFAQSQDISPETVKQAFEKIKQVRGRVEFVTLSETANSQPFDVVVDYAHTPDSLEQFYSVFKGKRNICILGNTGGGRDTWKRPQMASIAEENCMRVILTNEDPYDEDPHTIVNEMAEGIKNKEKLSIIMDRREAIREALTRAHEESHTTSLPRVAVLITGKGTDPYIMEAHGNKIPWDDTTIVREELNKIFLK